MKTYLIIFQFGPVQDFIQTARRTDDYWAGSFTLSYATAQVIALLEAQGGTIVFPNAANNDLVEAVRNSIPEEKFPSELLQPSLPNRVAALVKAEDVKSLKIKLEGIKIIVLGKLFSLFSKVENQLTGSQSIASKQIEDLFEFFYAFVTYDHENHKASLCSAEENLAARKNIRDFKPYSQQGFKCTQCGIREPFRGSASPEKLKEIQNYWKNLCINEYSYRFKDNERLCAICAGKRLLRKICFDRKGIPSTSTIAVSAWVSQVAALLNFADKKTHYDIVTDFSSAVQKAELSNEMTPVPRNGVTTHPLYNIEGDCFIDDTYDRFEKEAEKKEIKATVEDIKMARARLKKMFEFLPDNLKKPPKYYAIMAFDGDSIGPYLKTLKTIEEHMNFSQQLAGFTKTVYQTVHQEFHGYVIYYGGDEGIVLVPLSEAIEVMDKLRKDFNRITVNSESVLTMSVGVAVVHHQAPLGQGLKAAGEALKAAKNVKGKNAFAFHIRKRSGSIVICESPWEIEKNGCPYHMTDFMKCWHEAYDKGFSTSWYHQYSALAHICQEDDGKYDPDMAINEFCRILPRHDPDENKKTAVSLIHEIQAVIFGHECLMKADNLLSLLYLPIYISQGGQD